MGAIANGRWGWMSGEERDTGRNGARKLVRGFEGRRSIGKVAMNTETLWNWSSGIEFDDTRNLLAERGKAVSGEAFATPKYPLCLRRS